MLTVGSLFAGIGGIELGLERAGMRTLWQVENNPFSIAALEHHWPDVERFADVRDCGKGNLRPVDVICGGFPCQDISLAGKGAGIAEGTRSGLWGEFARIVRELRPRYVLVENVAPLRGRGLDRVLGDLAESGYDAEWDCIPASAIGAPHRRDRIWIVAYPNGERSPERGERPAAPSEGALRGDAGGGSGGMAGQERLQGAGQGAGDVADATGDGRLSRGTGDAAQESGGRESHRGCIGTHVLEDPDCCTVEPRRRGRRAPQAGDGAPVLAYSDGTGLEGRIFNRKYASEWLARARSRAYADQWSVEPAVGRVAHGIPARVVRLAALGNAVVPQNAEYIGELIVADAEAEEAA